MNNKIFILKKKWNIIDYKKYIIIWEILIVNNKLGIISKINYRNQELDILMMGW